MNEFREHQIIQSWNIELQREWDTVYLHLVVVSGEGSVRTGISRVGVNKQTFFFFNFYFFTIASAFCKKIVVLRQAGVYPRCSLLSLQLSYYSKPNFNQFFPITQHRGYPPSAASTYPGTG